MDSTFAAVAVAAVTFTGGLLGMWIYNRLPENVTTGALKEMTGAVQGLLSALTALVLGLLIWTAYGVHSSQIVNVRTLATQYLDLDQALLEYGPEADSGRARLKEDAARTISEIWSDDGNYIVRNYGATVSNWRSRANFLKALRPTSDEQKQALAAATQSVGAIARTRTEMAIAQADAISRPLVVVVVSWATCIFVSFGLMHARTLHALSVLAVGSIALATAVYLLLGLSHPYSGLFRVSSDPIEEAVALMNR